MPGAWWHFEKWDVPLLTFKLRYQFSLTCCENNEIIFKNAALRMPRCNRGLKISYMGELGNASVVTNRRNIVLIHCDIVDFILTTQHKFDVVWLDFCGPISSKLESLLLNVGKVLHKPSILAVTILKARETKDYVEVVGKNRIEFLYNFLGDALSAKIDLMDSIEYCDSTPMLQTVFKITEHSKPGGSYG